MGNAADEIIFEAGDFTFGGHVVDDDNDADDVIIFIEDAGEHYFETKRFTFVGVGPFEQAGGVTIFLVAGVLDEFQEFSMGDDFIDGRSIVLVEVKRKEVLGGMVGHHDPVEFIGDQDGFGDTEDNGFGLASFGFGDDDGEIGWGQRSPMFDKSAAVIAAP